MNAAVTHSDVLLGALLNGHPDLGTVEAMGVTAECFEGTSRSIFEVMTRMRSCDLCEIAPAIDDPRLISVMSNLQSLDSSRAWRKAVPALLFEFRQKCETRALKDHLHAVEQGNSSQSTREALQKILAAPDGTRTAALDETLDRYRLDPELEPEPLCPSYRLGNHIIATPGNIETVGGQSKVGKTGLLTGLIAAPMDPVGDVFGLEAHNPENHALLHIDTEQSKQDHHRVVKVALQRAGKKSPSWFYSYHLLNVDVADRFVLLERAMDRAADDHGGIFSVIIDGIGDFIEDSNDLAASFRLVQDLHKLANRHQTVIFCVLHINPASQDKLRGHLGSQLDRKAETNLMLTKDGVISTIFATRARHCMILKPDGQRFEWDPREGMHLSVGTKRETQERAKIETLKELAIEVFLNYKELRYKELSERLQEYANCKQRTAEGKIREMLDHGIVEKTSTGCYRRKT